MLKTNPMAAQKKVGLSLSGGGYRAAAFHLGTLYKLNELRLLDQVDVISSISGGSIIGACYCLNDSPFDTFYRRMYEDLCTKSIIRYVLTSRIMFIALFLFFLYLAICIGAAVFVSGWLLIPLILGFFYLTHRYQFRLFPVSKAVEKAYDNYFYQRQPLSALRDKPELAIGSTNLQTCRPFTFSKRKMEDSTYAYRTPPIRFSNDTFPIARAVAASTCVPSFFSPVTIDRVYFKDSSSSKLVKPVLVDGGVYDNQGIQKLTQSGSSYECDTIIASDAGNKLPFEGAYNNTFILLLRTMEAFMARIKNFQMANHLYDGKMRSRNIAYFSLGWDLNECINGFVRNLRTGNVPLSTINAHRIPAAYYQEPDKSHSAIINILKANVNYKKLIGSDLTIDELFLARRVSTNLTPLSRLEMDVLIKHAGNLAEIQLRLYCPNFFQA